MKTTSTEYSTFEIAYNHFNKTLFNNALHDCIITLQRVKKARGYFSPEKFSNRKDESRTHEIALNPDSFDGRTDKEILSTLVHEMCHLKQQEEGTAPRRAYHDKIFASIMLEIGLQPTHDGTPTGKQTGQSMTHLIIKEGKFDQQADKFLNVHSLNWQSSDIPTTGKDPNKTKTKFTCPVCHCNAWGKADLHLICGDCGAAMWINQ